MDLLHTFKCTFVKIVKLYKKVVKLCEKYCILFIILRIYTRIIFWQWLKILVYKKKYTYAVGDNDFLEKYFDNIVKKFKFNTFFEMRCSLTIV